MGEAAESRSLLLVHAHPDDESIGTGATMARYAAEGARVTLVTCTLGEIGEIIPPDLQHMLPDELGEYRIGELEEACAALGVADHRFLGGPARWRDSGMMGMEENEDPRCFWRASLDEAAATLAEVIQEVRPQAIVTYDANGFYGHPDHIQAHRVAWRARELAAAPSAGDTILTGEPWLAARFYATALPVSVAQEAAKLPADSWFEAWADFESCVTDDQVTTEIDASGYLDAKIAAMQAHATQITVDGDFYALSNNRGHRILGTEYYIQLAGPPGNRNDLFSPGCLSPVPCWIMGTEPGGRRGSLAASAVIYVVLLVLGAFQGLIGSFQYDQSPAPVIAILLIVIIFATCLFGGWGTSSLGGALAPAIGWIVVSFLLSIGTHAGSVIITNTTAGKWYLYGGTLAAAIGAASGLIFWLRARPAG